MGLSWGLTSTITVMGSGFEPGGSLVLYPSQEVDLSLGSLALYLSQEVGLSWGLTSTIPVTGSGLELGVH